MNVIMYHYVRRPDPSFPYFIYLHQNDFLKQLDFFASCGYLPTRHDFDKAWAEKKIIPNAFLLTFDDGLKEHFTNVLPALIERKTFGFFYVSSAPYLTGKLLNVHRIHLLLGRFGGQEMMHQLLEIIDLDNLSFRQNKEFQQSTYKRQINDRASLDFKRILNFFAGSEEQNQILDQLMGAFPDEKALVEQHYMGLEEIKKLDDNGMIVGNHTNAHEVMSKLSLRDQQRTVQICDTLPDSIIPDRFKTFCYPHGGDHTFTNETEQMLRKAGFELAFNVDPQPISQESLVKRCFALSRFDCCQFPFGKASRGFDYPS